MTKLSAPVHSSEFGMGATDSIWGLHVNVRAAIGNDKGTDAYRIALRNDWTMESFHWRAYALAGEASVTKPREFTKGPNWSPSVQWEITPGDLAEYYVAVTIGGPIGVPHK